MSRSRQHRRPVLHPHRPRPRPRVERIVGDALNGADDGELFLEYSQSEALGFDDGRLKSASFDTTQGFGLRAVAGEAAGYAHATELSARRRSSAPPRRVKAVHAGHGGKLAVPPRGTNRSLYTDDNPLADGAVRAQGQAAGRDRRLCPGQGPARAPGHGLALRRLAGGADPARRRHARRRHPPAGPAQRHRRGRRGRPQETGSHGTGGRTGYDRLSRPRDLARRPSTRRCARRWSISARCRRRPAR